MLELKVNLNDLLGAYYERVMHTINQNGWWLLPAAVVKECAITDKVLALCHIITNNTAIVKEIALLEKDLGIQATYLYSNMFELNNPREAIAFLSSLGHEVGICAELLVPFMQEYKHPHETLRELLEPFKELGVQPRGLLCPESPYSKALRIDNYDYFFDFGKEKTMKVELDGDGKVFRPGVHPIAEYGFEYVISKLEYAHEYDNFFELIQPEDTGRSILYLNVEMWEVS
jgi:hypothetical protein